MISFSHLKKYSVFGWVNHGYLASHFKFQSHISLVSESANHKPCRVARNTIGKAGVIFKTRDEASTIMHGQ